MKPTISRVPFDTKIRSSAFHPLYPLVRSHGEHSSSFPASRSHQRRRLRCCPVDSSSLSLGMYPKPCPPACATLLSSSLSSTTPTPSSVSPVHSPLAGLYFIVRLACLYREKVLGFKFVPAASGRSPPSSPGPVAPTVPPARIVADTILFSFSETGKSSEILGGGSARVFRMCTARGSLG